MKKSEIAKLLTLIVAAYPEKIIVDDIKVNLWYTLLGDISYEIASIAVKKHILESPFAPTIADIRKSIVAITTPAELKISFAVAWGEVTRAISMFGYSREDEALQSMSPKTIKVVKMIGWQNICFTEEIDVLRGQFRMMYETTDAREKQDALIPIEMMAQMSEISGKLKMLEDSNKKLVVLEE